METCGKALEMADRLNEIADELKGMAKILWVMYECVIGTGSEANHLLVLARLTERYCQDIRDISKQIHLEEER